MPPKPRNPGGGGSGNTPGGKPSQQHGNINAGKGITSAQHATGQAAAAGHPHTASQQTTPGSASTTPTKPTTPPTAQNIRHTPESEAHILDGDGGRSGGHLAGSGFSKKTEFPKSWTRQDILDAAYQVTQQGPPAKGPYPTKDANGNLVWAYDYEGVVNGVTVKTTVQADGQIRTAYPPNPADPGVITNPPSPNPAPQGIPQAVPPRYSHPDVGGNGSWTWEGPKGDKIIRVVQDAQGNVTTTELGPYKKK